MFPLGVEVLFSCHHEDSVLFSSNPNKLFLRELLVFTDIYLIVRKFYFSVLKYQLL